MSSKPSDTEISFRVEDVLDHDPEINPATDYLIECKRCGEIRHKSWFQVNWPACAACMQFDKLFLDNLTDELVMADIRRVQAAELTQQLPQSSHRRPVKRRRR